MVVWIPVLSVIIRFDYVLSSYYAVFYNIGSALSKEHNIEIIRTFAVDISENKQGLNIDNRSKLNQLLLRHIPRGLYNG